MIFRINHWYNKNIDRNNNIAHVNMTKTFIIILIIFFTAANAQNITKISAELDNINASVATLQEILSKNVYNPGNFELSRLKEDIASFRDQLVNTKNSKIIGLNESNLKIKSLSNSFIYLKSSILPYIQFAAPFVRNQIDINLMNISRSLYEIENEIILQETPTDVKPNDSINTQNNFHLTINGLDKAKINNNEISKIITLLNKISLTENLSNRKIQNIDIKTDKVLEMVSRNKPEDSYFKIIKWLGTYIILIFLILFLCKLVRYYLKLIRHYRDRHLAFELHKKNPDLSLNEALIIMSSSHIDFNIPKMPVDLLSQYYSEKAKTTSSSCCCCCHSKCGCKEEQGKHKNHKHQGDPTNTI